MNKVDAYLLKVKQWRDEFEQLRRICLDCGLDEEFKWRHPCYAYHHSNIVLIHGFKEYCALLFFKGALLQDTQGILIQQTENVQGARQLRFTHVHEILDQEKTIKEYIFEAVEVEKAGLKVPLKKTAEFEMAEEFQTKLDEMPALEKAFTALTPGRQRGYLLYFSTPKQAKTRMARVEKYIDKILAGKGLND
ncbi:MAG: YdeI family protein [Saprospiraceae bacterium]